MSYVPLPKDARNLLKSIKKVQTSLNDYVYIDYLSQRIYPVSNISIELDRKAIENNIYSTFKVQPSNFHGTMQYLIDNNLVKKSGASYHYQLSYLGRENSYLTRCEIMRAILTHIVFPSVVAFITTIITLFFTSK